MSAKVENQQKLARRTARCRTLSETVQEGRGDTRAEGGLGPKAAARAEDAMRGVWDKVVNSMYESVERSKLKTAARRAYERQAGKGPWHDMRVDNHSGWGRKDTRMDEDVQVSGSEEEALRWVEEWCEEQRATAVMDPLQRKKPEEKPTQTHTHEEDMWRDGVARWARSIAKPGQARLYQIWRQTGMNWEDEKRKERTRKERMAERRMRQAAQVQAVERWQDTYGLRHMICSMAREMATEWPLDDKHRPGGQSQASHVTAFIWMMRDECQQAEKLCKQHCNLALQQVKDLIRKLTRVREQ